MSAGEPSSRGAPPTEVPEVWARPAWMAVDLARRAGLSDATLFAGLPFDAAGIRRMKRVRWEHYCTLIERIETMAGGPEPCAELLARSLHETAPELAFLRRSSLSVKAFYRLVYEVLNPIAFPCVRFSYQDIGTDTIRIGTGTRPGVSPSRTLIRTAHGALRGLTLHLGLPAAEVTPVAVTDEVGLWEVALPRSQTIVARFGRAVRMLVLGVEADGAEVSMHLGEQLLEGSRLERAVTRWGLTKRQADVLDVVARGGSTKEAAAALGCSEDSIDLHMTHVMRRADVTSRAELVARFWSDDD